MKADVRLGKTTFHRDCSFFCMQCRINSLVLSFLLCVYFYNSLGSLRATCPKATCQKHMGVKQYHEKTGVVTLMCVFHLFDFTDRWHKSAPKQSYTAPTMRFSFSANLCHLSVNSISHKSSLIFEYFSQYCVDFVLSVIVDKSISNNK